VIGVNGPSTTTVHAGQNLNGTHSVVPPIYQTANFWSDDVESFAANAVAPRGSSFYTRYGNPNHSQVAAVIAQLEHSESAMVTASGMAALTTAVLALVSAGDHVIGQKSTYGGTASVLQNLLPRLGVTTTTLDQTDVTAFTDEIRPETKLILLETPSNPLLQITDLEAVCTIAHSTGALVIADNTFATPINQRPIDFGVDIVWHSATKYLNGHSDVLAGVIAGPATLLDRIWEVGLLTGAVLGPIDAWLLLRGLRTLPLRMQRHNQNGAALASRLAHHPAVAAVHYPGLADHPQHDLAAAQMRGFGGVLGVELAGDASDAGQFISHLKLARISASLGGTETLVVHPSSMWRGMLSDEQILDAGVKPGLVRIAAGLEDTDDLIDDVLSAADSVAKP